MEMASTVTDLVADFENAKKCCNTRSKSPKYVGSYGDEDFYSSSKLLNKYIKDYDKSQAWDLAKALTTAPKFPAQGFSENNENEIKKEIDLAKRLLGNSRTCSENDDIGSLTTDDLLVSNPLGTLGEIDLNISKSNLKKARSSRFSSNRNECSTISKPTNVSSEKPSSLHFSDIASISSFRRKTDSATTDTLISGGSESNLFSLNGTSYTPHKVKYASLTKSKSAVENHQFQQQTANDNSVSHSPTPTNLSLNERSVPENVLAINAGRTPFRSRVRSLGSSQESSFDTSTEILLHGDRPWEANLPRKTCKSISTSSHISVPFNVEDKSSDIREFIKDCLADDIDKNLNLTTPKSSGSVETLKNMLFTLQSISSNDELHSNVGNGRNNSDAVLDGHSSLKRAMSHLSNLKDLTRK